MHRQMLIYIAGHGQGKVARIGFDGSIAMIKHLASWTSP
jgi:hypothetical protein